MTAIPLWEATLITLLIVVLMACGFAVLVLMMSLRNSRAAVLAKEQRDREATLLKDQRDREAALLKDQRDHEASLVKEQHDKKTKELEEQNEKLQVRVTELETLVRFLTKMLESNRTLSPAEVDLLHNVAQTNSRLLMAMQLSFNNEELQVLCFEMGMNFDNVPGSALDTKIVNLIGAAQRLGRLPELIQRVKAARPQLHLEALS